ncbi:hypothetical protein PR202_gb02901 [Eleusine coracana subsp. coracana]|uniref:Protein MIZU-KUSSEI 1 n=1 Tax=Eleusine coracana subsp. coracana TaxID=191504 RepID=A0AAV5DZR7_ELECO|nr:hypothetical protein QOZ80_8BG0663340 [Eleusine coracana subsp. coracana]GJN15952.1 hypothetical protein PR202_gb02901 [Eleusine coracana subsp. coracana]
MPSLIDGAASLRSLLRPTKEKDDHHQGPTTSSKHSGSGPAGGGVAGLFKMFKLVPMLTTGYKVAALLGRHHHRSSSTRPPPQLADHAPTVTLFGQRRGRLSLAIHEDTRAPPVFLIELPVLASALHREMVAACGGGVKLALESDTRRGARRQRLVEEYVWAVYCNGRKAGYAIRRKDASDDERHVLRLLRGVSMGAGVLPPPPDERRTMRTKGSAAVTPASAGSAGTDGEITYMRARVERVVGSKDSEAFYMINPDDGGGDSAPELSIFLVRKK